MVLNAKDILQSVGPPRRTDGTLGTGDQESSTTPLKPGGFSRQNQTLLNQSVWVLCLINQLIPKNDLHKPNSSAQRAFLTLKVRGFWKKDENKALCVSL
jgi:hypothetical protein